MRGLPSVDRLRELLNYNPETGEFTWKIGRKKAPMGGRAGYILNGYLTICIDYRKFGAHRAAWALTHGEWADCILDHKNCNTLDNSISNLRLADKSKNAHNTGLNKNNTTGYKCVYWNKVNRRWQALIQIKGKIKHIGLYDTPEEAQAGYLAYAKTVFGDFARVSL